MRPALLLALLAAAALALAQPYLSPVSVSWVRRPAGPGDVGVVRLSLASFAAETLLNARARVECLGCCSLAGGGQVTLGSLSPGSARSLDVAVNFTGACGCVLRVLVDYDAVARQAPAGYAVSRLPGSASLEVALQPAFEPRVEVSAAPTSLALGSFNTVTLRVANAGFTSVRALSATVSASGAVLEGPAPLRIELPELRAGEARSYRLRVLPLSSVVTLTVSLSYVDEQGLLTERTLTYSLSASAGAVLVYLEPQLVPAASATPSTIVVRNLGGDALRNATLYLWAPPGSAASIEPAAVGLGDVPPGGSVRVPVTVRVPYGERGARSIPYTLVYLGEDGSPRVVRDSLSFVALEQARVEVTSVEVAPLRPAAGSLATVTVTVMNLGSAPLYGVNVSVALPEGLRPARGTSYFIGQLAPYTPTAVPFSFYPERPGSYTVEVRVEYRGYYGERLESRRGVAVAVGEAAAASPSQGGGAGGGGAPPGAAAAAAAAAIAVGWRVRRREGR